MNTEKNIALLCDYGLDDAIATLYLFENAHRFNKIDILPISGNFPVEKTFVNTKRLLSNAEKLPEGVRIVDTSSVPQRGEDIPEIHGKDGMGDILELEYEEKVPVISYEKWLEDVDDSYVIVSLGPCTVTLDILRQKGQLPLIMMAGNIAEPPNYKGYEFNHGVDTESFAECIKYPHAAVTLDTCHCPCCDLNKTHISKDGLLGKMIRRYHDLSLSRNEEICAIYDLTTVVYAIDPHKFSISKRTDKDGNEISVLVYTSNDPLI